MYVEGGDDAMLYGVGLSYNGTQGVMKQSGRDVLSFNIDLRYRKGKFSFDNKFTLDYTESQNAPQSFSVYVQTNPYYPKDYEGSVPKYLEESSIDGGFWVNKVENPLYNASLNYLDGSKEISFRNNFQMEWRPMDGIMARGRISLTKANNKGEKFKSPFHTDFDETEKTERGSYSKSTTDRWGYDGDVTVTYGKLLADMHQVNAVLGWNFSSTRLINDAFTAIGFPDDNVPNPAFANEYATESKPSYSESTTRSTSFYMNLNYAYNNRYLLDVNFRKDGSSVFGTNKRFTDSWSVGVAWNVHKEAFWSGDEKSSLKLRASVGSTGTTNFSSTQALTTYNYDFSKIYNGVFGVSLAGYGNPELKWQNTISYNVGVDMTLLKGLVTFNGDFYIKNTENLLLPLTVAPSTGFSSYVENIGKLRNTGIEGRLRLNLIRDTQRDLRWNVTLSAFHNKSKITKLSNQLEEINKYANSDWYNQGTVVYRQYEAGRSQTALMMVRSGGIDPATGNEVYIKRNGELTFEYDANDKVKCGDMKPTIEGNVNTNLTWKGFTLYMLFKYQFGAKAYNGTLASKVEGANPYKNADKRVLYDRWKEPGDHAKFRRIDDRTSPYQTTRLVFDNDLFSLSSVSLSYELPRDISQKIYADRVRLMLSTTDVFRLSTIKQERGTSYPFARTFNLSLNVTF